MNPRPLSDTTSATRACRPGGAGAKGQARATLRGARPSRRRNHHLAEKAREHCFPDTMSCSSPFESGQQPVEGSMSSPGLLAGLRLLKIKRRYGIVNECSFCPAPTVRPLLTSSDMRLRIGLSLSQKLG